MMKRFAPTQEQLDIINHNGSAFVSACPGAGKTRVMVERARRLIASRQKRRIVGFLSFTNAAVSELESRLRAEGLIGDDAFPNFVGTFDAFLWQFLIVPFGLPNFPEAPRLIPDLDKTNVVPYPKAHELTLDCFDRGTYQILPAKAARGGFFVEKKNPSDIAKYQLEAAKLWGRYRKRGLTDFAGVRGVAVDRIRDPKFGPAIAQALASRFTEILVDEAQDCNPEDLDIISWLRAAGLPVIVVCDPHQAIYSFRGGVTDELDHFRQKFDVSDQLPMTGNFRSNKNVCRATACLRRTASASTPDVALGELSSDSTAIHVLAYKKPVTSAIGKRYAELVDAGGLSLKECPLLAATRASGGAAIGIPSDVSEQITVRLGAAVTDFQFGYNAGNMVDAIEELHHVMLRIEGRLGDKTYHQYRQDMGDDALSWRPPVLSIGKELRFDPVNEDADQWLERAQRAFEPRIVDRSRTIKQRLPNNKDLAQVLAAPPPSVAMVRTIHSVKGEEFPGVCVLMTARDAKGIFDFLETGAPQTHAENSREIFVAASRAKKLLVLAIPRTQAPRLVTRMKALGADVNVEQL